MIAWALIIAAAVVDVDDASGCIDVAATLAALERTADAREVPDDVAIVVVTTHTATLSAALRIVSPQGELLYDRDFTLAPEDCASTPELFRVALQTYLRALPGHPWRRPTPKPIPVVEPVVVLRDTSQVASMVFAAAGPRLAPVSADVEVGVSADVGSMRHRLTASLALRLGLPRTLGTGNFVETYALVGVGWRYGAEGWLARAELQTGGLLVSGFGFESNRRTWLPWLEFKGAVLWRIGDLLLGPQLGLSPLSHDIVTGGGSAETISRARVGVAVAFPLWTQRI